MLPNDTSIAMPLVDAALAYRAAGLSVIATAGKEAVCPWTAYQSAIPTEQQIADMFMHPRAEQVAVICGAVSGNLECLDFDDGGSAWPMWSAMVEEELPGFLARLPMERSPSGGRHVLYRVSDMIIPGGKKLAQRPAKIKGEKNDVLIETRAEKQYFCAAPSPGYEMLQGDLTAIPTISPAERAVLIRLAESLDETPVPEERLHGDRAPLPAVDGDKPGDDYNRRGNMREILTRHGWRYVRTVGVNEHWRRPGKNAGTSATIRHIDGADVLYVFSTSTAFEAGRGYRPFSVATMLDHNGDFAMAARDLRQKGFGGDIPTSSFDTTAFMANMATQPADNEDKTDLIPNPGLFPENLLRVPGFLGDFSGFINRKAVKPQPVLSLGAAIVALGTLTGRKVEGMTGLRTNVYVLGVAESGTGKDKPRELVRQLLHDPDNLLYYAIDRLKSDAGIRSALEITPCVVFLLDEIGEFLDTIKNARNSPWLKNIIPEMMMLYSLAGSPNVRLGGMADTKKTVTVDCPHLCLFGTSVPKSVFRSMTMDSVSGGFLGRLLIFESSAGNPKKQRPSNESVPASVLDAAVFWREFKPNGGLTGGQSGTVSRPIVIEESAEATRIFDQCEAAAREEIEKYGAEWSGPYNRAEENARKLALLYACSENAYSPFIGTAAATWGCQLSLYLTRRLVYLANINVADNETHDRRNKVLRLIVDAGEKGISKTSLAGKTRSLKPRELGEIIDALVMSEEIIVVEVKTKTKPRLMFWENNCNNCKAAAVIRSSQLDTS